MSKPLRLHWSASKPNFGDSLSPLLCEIISGRKVVLSEIKKADLVAVGSLLHRLPESFLSRKVHVWGTGFIEAEKPHVSRHHYHALRGALSREIVQAPTSIALGDPGLLAHLLIDDAKVSKTHAVGLVPHYKDKHHPLIQQLSTTTDKIKIIDIFLPPSQFLKQLQSCEVIFSSAMHGLIAADSLQIPNARIQLGELIRGGDFKFHDYYSVFDGVSALPVELNVNNLQTLALSVAEQYYRPNIDAIQTALINSFPQL